MAGCRIGVLNIHRAVRLRVKAANRNPTPPAIRAARLDALAAEVARVTEKARRLGLYRDPG